MSGLQNPTYEPLVTDFDVEWDELPEGVVPEGHIHEHGLVKLDNGYTVSLLRSNVPGHENKGIEDGLWEAVATRPTTNPLLLMMGMDRQPAPELDHLHDYQYAPEADGPWVAGDLDSAKFNAFVASVQAQPRFEGEDDDMAILNSLLTGGAEE